MNYEFRPTHIEHYCADYPGQMKEEDPKPVRIEGLTVITEDVWHFGGRCYTRKELEAIGYFYVPIKPGSDYVAERYTLKTAGTRAYNQAVMFQRLARAARRGFSPCTVDGRPATIAERLEIANLFEERAADELRGIVRPRAHGLARTELMSVFHPVTIRSVLRVNPQGRR